MTTAKKFNSNELTIINSLIVSNIESFLKYFDVQLNSDNKKFFGPCPIHSNSDNEQAIIIYKNSCVWLCTTHSCHDTFTKTPIGLIRALLSSKKYGWQDKTDTNKVSNINEAIQFIYKLLNKSYGGLIAVPKDVFGNEKRNFTRQSKLFRKTRILSDKESFNKICKIPSEYFLNRGFSKEILIRYQIGVLNKPGNEFHNCNVIPIYDNFYQNVIGLTSRTDHPKCLVCSQNHDPKSICLDSNNVYKPKWSHSNGFRANSVLFNYWMARECIKNTNKIILVEGPIHVLRLEEAGFCNSLAMFGSSLSLRQANLIRKSYINDIILLTDNDEAGELASEQIKRILGSRFKFNTINLDRNDIAEYSINEVKNVFA